MWQFESKLFLILDVLKRQIVMTHSQTGRGLFHNGIRVQFEFAKVRRGTRFRKIGHPLSDEFHVRFVVI